MASVYLLEGIDRVGKDSLVDNLQHRLGYHLVVHKTKPARLDYYVQEAAENRQVLPPANPELFLYQRASFYHDMSMIRFADRHRLKMIYNRAWLGELVYGPLYRHYSADYIFDLEREAKVDRLENTKLVLLTTSNFELLIDDNLSFNVKNQELEQRLFIEAFDRSMVRHKKMIDVHDGRGQFKTFEQILAEAI